MRSADIQSNLKGLYQIIEEGTTYTFPYEIIFEIKNYFNGKPVSMKEFYQDQSKAIKKQIKVSGERATY